MTIKLRFLFLTLALSGLLPAANSIHCWEVVEDADAVSEAARGPDADSTAKKIAELRQLLADLHVQAPMDICLRDNEEYGRKAYQETYPTNAGPVVVVSGEKVDISIVADKTVLTHGSWKTKLPSSMTSYGSPPSVLGATIDVITLYTDLWGHKKSADWLLDHKADVNAKHRSGDTPLHLAAERENVDAAKFLLANNANVNAKDNIGDTPLHNAVAWGHREMVELLLAKKANVNAIGSGGTPLHLATLTAASNKNSNDILALLRQYGGIDLGYDGRTFKPGRR